MNGRRERLGRWRRRDTAKSDIGRRRFEELIDEALEGIPEPFRSRLENVAVLVEEEPSAELLGRMGMRHSQTLLGLYEGIPVTERGESYNLVVPDRITLFRRPILAICSNPEEVKREVRHTILHEVAHYYGMTDEDLLRMQFDEEL